MNLLLDTHILIWYAEGSSRLLPLQLQFIANKKNNKFISSISLYEMTIKFSLKKLSLKLSLNEYFDILNEFNIEILPINQKYLSSYLTLPTIENHKDPFDKLIIATAIAEGMSIVTNDSKFKYYDEFVNIYLD